MRKQIIIFCLTVFLLFVFSETAMLIRYRAPASTPETSEFKYQYVDIYEKFFQRMRKGNKYIYTNRRLESNAKDFLVVKNPGIIRIFIVGGSVGYNFGLYPFESALKQIMPNKEFEVICCGMGAYDSYRDYLVEKEIVRYKPDLIIAFSGNNEFYDKAKINLWGYYLNKFLRKSWAYSKLQDRFFEWCVKLSWIPFRDKKERIIEYERNIRLMVRIAKAKKVPMILCTLPVNLRDCPPFGTSPKDKSYLLGRFLLERKSYPGAINALKQFLEDNPNDAFGFYFLARAYEGIKDYSKAKEYYLRSLDLDFVSGGRANREINDIIRKICAEERVGIADVELAFTDLAPYGLSGREQFSDNCHWYVAYDPLIAEVIIRTLFKNKEMFSNIVASVKRPDSLALSYNLPSLKQLGLRKTEVKDRVNAAVLGALKGGDELSERAISAFETLYFTNPDALWAIQYSKDKIKDFFLGDFWTKEYVSELGTHWPNVLYHVGETYRRLGLYNESVAYFQEALSLNKKLYLAYIGCALTHYSTGNREKARKSISEAERASDALLVRYYKEILGFN